MMHGPKKSDPADVAMKPTNKAGQKTAAESAERRAGAKGTVDQQSTHRTQIRARVSQALGRVRQAAKEQQRSSKGAQRAAGNAAGRPEETEVIVIFRCRAGEDRFFPGAVCARKGAWSWVT